MNSKEKRLVSLLLVLCLCLTMLPVMTMQTEAATTLYWPLDTKWGISTSYTGYKNHDGVDMAATQGTPVYANFSGTATFYQCYTTINGTNYLTSYGNCVYVTSADGVYWAVYGHLNAFEGFNLQIPSSQTKRQSGSTGKITIGSKQVTVGDVIGYVGNTGNSTGNHLHYGLKVNGTFVDPANYLDRSVSANTAANAGTGTGTTCSCSESYAGTYICTTASSPLTIRSGHGSTYGSIGSIPSGAAVTVSKASGTGNSDWAHVTYNGISGYASMQYLEKKGTTSSSSGATGTYSESQFAEKIAYLKTVYRDYEYWNNYNACGYEGTGTKKCPSCSGPCSASCTDQCGKFYLNGTYYGGQCFGFANKMAYLVFGSVPDKSKNASHTWTYATSVSNYYAGDYVRIRNDRHSIFITGVNGDTITYVDCNNIGSCQVKWDRTISKSSLQSITTYVYHLPGNTLTGSGNGSSSGTTTTTHTADPTYAGYLPIKAYPKSTGKIAVYDVNGTMYSNRNITGSSDLCTIKAIYTDGWCWVEYPSSVEADGYFDAYVKWSVFSDGTSPSAWTSAADYTAYRRSDLAASIGSVSNGDRCLVVYSSGNLKQVIYPVSSAGYWKMGWIKTAAGATTVDSDFPVPILGYNYSADTRTTVYASTATMGTYYGQIFVDDLCTINRVSISGNWVEVSYPAGGTTKIGYTYLDQFFPALAHIGKPYTTTVSARSTAYRKADMATSYGYAEAGDTITVVGKSGNLYQVIYQITVGANAGKYKLAWIYGDHIVKNLTSIAVTAKPSKTVYLEGEPFSTAGMVVTAYYDDGSSQTVTGYSYSGYTSTPGSKTVVISYGGKTAAIDVTVKSKSPKALTITTPPSNTTYFVGKDFDVSGMVVKATYDNGTTSNVTDYHVSYDFSVAGTRTVTISYQYNGVTVNTTLSVTVVDVTVSSIAITSKPTKTTYYVGDVLNTAGLTLKATYSDGNTEIISGGFSCTPNELNAAGTQTITVSYSGKTAAFAVTVKELPSGAMSVSQVSGVQGENVTVAIKMDSNSGIIAARLKVSYDSEALTLTEAKDGGILGEYMFGRDLSANPYILTWENGLATSDYTATGTLVYLTFKIAENAPIGVLPITVSYDPEEIYNIDQVNAAFAVTQGAVTVEKYEPQIDIAITQVTLRPSNAGLYFSGKFNISKEIAVSRQGIAVSVYSALPVADGTDTNSLWTEGTTSLMVSNILNGKLKDTSNAKRGAMYIYARAYVELADGTYVYGDAVSVNLQQVAESADTQWQTLDDLQKAGFAAMYKKFNAVMSAWNLSNVKKNGN